MGSDEPIADEPGADKIKEYEAIVQRATGAEDIPLDGLAVQKIGELINDVESHEDPIYQVNCLQIMADLACSKQALKILEDKQVPSKLINILNQGDPLIVPHALKFFYRVKPTEIERKYPQVLNIICHFCNSDNNQLLDYAVDIIAAIARNGLEARQVLDRHPDFREKCLAKFGSVIISSDGLLKSRTLVCIRELLEIHDSDPRDTSRLLSEKFYHCIIEGANRMTNQLLALCKVPFLEIRINAMLVVSTVAGQEWAQKELAAHPRFVEWILNRSSETCKESKEAKFKILEAIVKSSTASKYFKSEDYLKMRADSKNGPFHVGIAEEMLMDSQQAS